MKGNLRCLYTACKAWNILFCCAIIFLLNTKEISYA
nr:MAG TPA: hypothetical protein [Caudoviricetes sp.]